MRFYATMFCRRRILLLLFSFMAATGAMAQVGQSPYTVRGIGNINSLATVRTAGMGGVGIGNTSPLFISIQNPALLGYTAYYTTAMAGFSVESRGLATDDFEDRLTSGGFDYLSIAFPILRNRIAFNVGLVPYSTVSYNLQTTEPIQGLPNSNAFIMYEGSGGLTQAYAAIGMNLYKGITAGVRASYLFGGISEKITTTLINDAADTRTAVHYSERGNYSDVLLSGGLGYRKELNKEKQSFLMAGLTYELESNINGKHSFNKWRLQTVSDEAGRPAGTITISDTLANNAEGTLLLPAALGAGVSFGRIYRYMVGADFRTQNWERYRNFESGNDEGLGQSYRLAVGGEWTPNYISRNYFNRVTYRTGVQAEKTPFLINGKEINEFGINFGLTLPVGASGVHTSLMLGQRGNTDNNLIRERFFRVSLGVTLNERWFERYKYD